MFGPIGSTALMEIGPQLNATSVVIENPDQIFLVEATVQSGAGDAETLGGRMAFARGEAPLMGSEGDPSTAGQSTLRWSDRPYITEPTDLPPDTYYEARATQPLSITRNIMIAPVTTVDGAQRASVVLENGDGALSSTIVSQAIDGQPVTVKVGSEGLAYDEFVAPFVGSGVQFQSDERTVTLLLRDNSYLLDVPVQPNRYAGTGTYEGTSDMEGTPIPLLMGKCRNVEPRLVDPANQIYQVNDGAVQAITAVYDQGVALTDQGDTGDLYSGSTTSGNYRTDESRGLFQIETTPTGRITADAEGDDGDGYVSTIAEIALRLLRDKAGTPARYFNLGSFASLALDVTGTAGIYLRDVTSGREVLSRLMRGIGAIWYCNRAGQITVKRMAAPSESDIAIELDVNNVIRLRKIALPSGIYPPTWRWMINFQRNWTVQTSDLAGSVTTSRRQFLELSWRTANASDTSVQTKHLNATDAGPIDSYLDEEADAASLASDLQSLHGPDRQMFEATVDSRGLDVEMNDSVRLAWPEFQLNNQAFRAWPLREDMRNRETTLLLWG